MSASVGPSSATAVFSESERVLRANLTDLYGAPAAAAYTSKFIDLIASTDTALRRSEVNEADAVLIAFGDHFRRDGEPPLETLGSMARKHFRELIGTVHLLPFYPFTCDRGFGVSDFMNVHPDYGTWADIELMAEDFHLAFDVVVNHVSGSHPWFRAFLAGDPKYANYFITLDPDSDISNVFRPRTTPLLTPFETAYGTKQLWTTFSSDQIDLNYRNPEVLLEMVKTNYLLRGPRGRRSPPGRGKLHLERPEHIVQRAAPSAHYPATLQGRPQRRETLGSHPKRNERRPEGQRYLLRRRP